MNTDTYLCILIITRNQYSAKEVDCKKIDNI